MKRKSHSTGRAQLVRHLPSVETIKDQSFVVVLMARVGLCGGASKSFLGKRKEKKKSICYGLMLTKEGVSLMAGSICCRKRGFKESVGPSSFRCTTDW